MKWKFREIDFQRLRHIMEKYFWNILQKNIFYNSLYLDFSSKHLQFILSLRLRTADELLCWSCLFHLPHTVVRVYIDTVCWEATACCHKIILFRPRNLFLKYQVNVDPFKSPLASCLLLFIPAGLYFILHILLRLHCGKTIILVFRFYFFVQNWSLTVEKN